MQDPPDVLFRLRVALRNLPKEPPSKEGEEAQGRPGDRGEEEGKKSQTEEKKPSGKGTKLLQGKERGKQR